MKFYLKYIFFLLSFSALGQEVEWVIEPKFEFQDLYKLEGNEKFSAVKINNKWGLIDNNGVEQIGASNDSIIYRSTYFELLKNDMFQIANLQGKISNKTFYSGGYPAIYSNEIIVYRYNKDTTESFGLLDANGKILIPCIYENLYFPFQNNYEPGLGLIVKNSKKGIINMKGDFLTNTVYDHISFFSDKALLVKGTTKSIIDTNGKILITSQNDFDLVFENGNEFSEGLLLVKKKGKLGFINENLTTVIPFQFDNAYAFSNGFAAVQKNSKWGFINKKGMLVIPFKFDNVVSFFGRNKLAEVSRSL